MKNIMKFGVAAIVGVSLTACGGASYEEQLLDRLEEQDELIERVDRLALSGAGVVADETGRVGFTGVASIIAGPVNDGAILVGDANLSVNFNGSTSVSGSITNIDGLGNYNTNNPSSGDLGSYSGSIALSGGSVASSGNAVEVDYAGTIRGNGDTLEFDGNMTGEFRGNPDVRAVTLGGVDIAQHNGVGYNAFVGISAERD